MRKHFWEIALVLMIPLGIWGAVATLSPAPPGSPPPAAPALAGDDEAKAKPKAMQQEQAAPPASVVPVAWTTAVVPKPISPEVQHGLDWLVAHQLKDGAWGQGDESQHMRSGAELRDQPNVADTSIAALALIRSGSTPSSGPYRDPIARAVGYVRTQVESSDAQSLDVSTVKGTRVQTKLGPNIDTFLASLLLAEVKDRMPDPAANQTLDLALNKVLGKIKAHQKDDGTWDNSTGWAPILAQSMAGKGINRAYQNRAVVDETLRSRTEFAANAQLAMNPAATVGFMSSDITADTSAGSVSAAATRRGRSAGMGSAGVELYDRSSSLAVLSESVNSNSILEADLRKTVDHSQNQQEVAQAQEQLKRFDATKVACAEAQEAVVRRLGDKSFIAGFGSNGGEEFLSYMNIGESLVRQGGPEWQKWDASMTANLNRIQNDDGSWTGHHCITGRNFCTSTALLVLLGDRTPVPVQPSKPDKGQSVAP